MCDFSTFIHKRLRTWTSVEGGARTGLKGGLCFDSLLWSVRDTTSPEDGT